MKRTGRSRLRLFKVSVVAAVSLGLMAAAVPAYAGGVAVVPFLGPEGGRCAGQLAASLRAELTVVDWQPQWPRPNAKEYATLARWFEAHRRSSVEVWVLGTVSRGRVVLEVYDAAGVLLGLGRYALRSNDSCVPSRSFQTRVVGWATKRRLSPQRRAATATSSSSVP